MPNEDLIGSAESAAVVGVDRATFNRWVGSRIHPAVEFPGRTGARLFRREDVERLKAQAERKASA